MNKDTAIELVLDELERAAENHPSMASCHEGYAILKEEVDELWDEVKANQGSSHRGVSEAVQTAAMALRYLIDLCDEEIATEHTEKVIASLHPPEPRAKEYFGGYSG